MKKLTAFLLVSTVLVAFANDLEQKVKSLQNKAVAGTITVKDSNNILYSVNELQHLSKGSLVNGRVASVSACNRKNNAAVIPALETFHKDLKALNIELIVIPVPPKLAIMPAAGMKQGEAMKYLKPFYQELRAKNINVLDLSDLYLKSGAGLYCRTDAHWSPAGIALAVKELAKQIKLRGSSNFQIAESEITISGDLAKSLNPSTPETEKIKIKTVSGKTITEDTPVLLLGDSHTLIFSTGGIMLSSNGGLAEQLAAELKMPVDRMGVMGSASTVVRINLFRKASKNPEWLKNKKYVIYCFTAREFTESPAGWVKVPVLRKKR
ncbi:MAG: hypothetical protein J6W81_04370 [Lentisphaeria bacterium]|nr:hypothetical protein [Lentisphaeria bacterium]